MAITLTIKVAGVAREILNGSFGLTPKQGEPSGCKFTVVDATNVLDFKKWDTIEVSDNDTGVLFTGFVHTANRYKIPGPSTIVYHEIDCVDNHALANKKTTNKVYTGQYAGVIAADMAAKLKYEGVTAGYAIRSDTTQGDFNSGVLSGTAASSNLEDGCLELAPAGSTTTILENTTSKFGNGTLNGVSASNNALAPSAINAIKMVAVQSGLGIPNTYTYVKIWSGSLAVSGTNYLFYNVWIDPSSPEIKCSVDLVFTDGSTLRDNFNTSTGNEFSQNRLSPHPATDLDGYANAGYWYPRTFNLSSFSGKTISYVTVACEGDKPGTYTAWFYNILYLNSSFSATTTFFGSSLNVNPPQQMQSAGFSSTKVTKVTAYDCLTANRISPSYNISPTGINKETYLTWAESLPTNTRLSIKYSIDGGNSYTECTNNAALPNFPAGLALSSKSIQFLQTFYQTSADGTPASPESKPTLTRLQLTLNPSYTATKSDNTVSGTTNSEWNAGTHSNTQASNNVLQLVQNIRRWDNNTTDNEMTNITLFGGGATGPNTDTTCRQYVLARQFRMFVFNNKEARSRLDFAGSATYQNFTIEYDNYIDHGSMSTGIVYRTTNWSNYDNRHAYVLDIQFTSMKLGRGQNTGDGSDGVWTQMASVTIPMTLQTWHRVKVVVNGSNHQVYLDDVLYINVTDSTFSAAGYVALRTRNFSSTDGYVAAFDNVGISRTLTGNWQSASTSLTSLGTYGGSVVSWEDVSTDPDLATILVESTTNGGSSWQALTNGGSIQSLTAGQSLSGVSVKYRITLTTPSATQMPQVRYFVAKVLGGFSSSGTRISPVLDLAPAGIAGSTLVAWNAILPGGTSVTVATSTDGTTFTNVSSGGSISGITGQPEATLDTFDLLSGGSYTNTARTGGTPTTGWVWDTTDSLLTVSGGTNALLLNAAISRKDVDLMLDLDQSDCTGLVWRYQDPSNFYELDIFDSASNAGSTNVLKLYKVVSNVKTQIGTNIAVSFTRNRPRRIRLTMINAAINVYFEGVNVRSTTDASISTAGLCGLIEVSGVGRFYNFRIQPIGDSLAGKVAYTRVTLTSTDPTATPQLQDLVLAVLSPNITPGALIPTLDARRKFISSNMNEASEQSDAYWQIDQFRELIFTNREATPSPWVVHSDDILIDGLEVENSGDLYRNRHIMTGVKAQIVTSETFTGDGQTTSWTLGYPLVKQPSILVNGQRQLVGPKGSTGYDFYWEQHSNTITQDSTGTVLKKDVDILSVPNYTGEYDAEVVRDNPTRGFFPGTISQEELAEIAALDNVSFELLDQTVTKTASFSFSDIDVSVFESISVDINCTAVSGTSPSIQFFLERKAADGTYFILWQSSVITTVPTTASTSIGPGMAINQSLGNIIRLRVVIGGTSPSWTFFAGINGKLDPEAADVGVVEFVEDVSELNLDVPGANARGDSFLQRYGVIGRTIKFKTNRTGLWPGQYAPLFLSEHNFNDANMLISSANLTQKLTVDNSGNKSHLYYWQVEATEAADLGSWSKLLTNVLQKGGN